jgi:hypothetical protein
VADFGKEVKVMAMLHHPNLVEFVGFTRQDPSKKKDRMLHLRSDRSLHTAALLTHQINRSD